MYKTVINNNAINSLFCSESVPFVGAWVGAGVGNGVPSNSIRLVPVLQVHWNEPLP